MTNDLVHLLLFFFFFFQGSTFELQNQRQFTGFLHLEEETQIDDAIRRVINNLSPHDFNCLLNNDNADEEEEQETIMLTQEDRNDHKPKKSLTGIFTGHSDDDSDSDLISATTTVSITIFYYGNPLFSGSNSQR